jgi:hypothetical protein
MTFLSFMPSAPEPQNTSLPPSAAKPSFASNLVALLITNLVSIAFIGVLVGLYALIDKLILHLKIFSEGTRLIIGMILLAVLLGSWGAYMIKGFRYARRRQMWGISLGLKTYLFVLAGGILCFCSILWH